MSYAHSRAPSPGAPAVAPAARALLLVLFAINLILSVCAVKLAFGGVPVRSAVALCTLGIGFFAAPTAVVEACRSYFRLLLIIAFFGVLGALISVINDVSPGVIFQQVTEIHVQAAVGVILGAVVIQICGLGPTVASFLLAVGISAAFSMLQYIGLDFAWGLRKSIGQISSDPPITMRAYILRERPMGLSYSPVHLGTQACLAFAAFFAWRVRVRGRIGGGLDPQILAAIGGVVLICFISGNRSPLLGAVIFTGLYLFVAAPRLALVMLPFIVAAVPVAYGVLQILAQQGVRVASTDDGSAVGRAVLATFGWRLFLERPIGYGLDFDSTKHWPDFVEYLLYFGNPNQIRLFALHNYFIVVLNKYGIGLFLSLPLLYTSKKTIWAFVLPFVVYILHIAFHNDGPFQGDFLIWYVLAMCGAAHALAYDGREPTPRPVKGAAWRRV